MNKEAAVRSIEWDVKVKNTFTEGEDIVPGKMDITSESGNGKPVSKVLVCKTIQKLITSIKESIKHKP